MMLLVYKLTDNAVSCDVCRGWTKLHSISIYMLVISSYLFTFSDIYVIFIMMIFSSLFEIRWNRLKCIDSKFKIFDSSNVLPKNI